MLGDIIKSVILVFIERSRKLLTFFNKDTIPLLYAHFDSSCISKFSFQLTTTFEIHASISIMQIYLKHVNLIMVELMAHYFIGLRKVVATCIVSLSILLTLPS